MVKRFSILFPLFFLVFNLHAEIYTISTVSNLPVSEICSYVLTGIYKKAGLEIEIVQMPPDRATIESTSGRIDGETHRIFDYGNSHPELIRIPFPYYKVEVTMYTLKSSKARNSDFDQLSQFRFVILKGIKNSKDLTRGFPNVLEVNDSETMFQLLELGRVDFVISSNIHGMQYINKLNLENVIAYSQPLAVTPLYHYVNIKNSSIIPIIEQTMSEMSRTGELDSVIAYAESVVLGRE